MIKCSNKTHTFQVDPTISYRSSLEHNQALLQGFVSNNSLESATNLIRNEKGFRNVSQSDVQDALFGDGSVRGRKGLLTSINQSLSSEGNPDRPAPIEMSQTETQGVYKDQEGNTYVKGLVVDEIQKEFIPMGMVNRIKRLISEKLGLAKWVSVKVDTWQSI